MKLKSPNKQLLLVFFLCVLAYSTNCYSQSTEKRTFTKADTLRGKLTPLRTCYNVLKYNLDLKIDIEKKYISGSNTFKIIANNDFQKLQIDLFENMNIQKIEFENQELIFTRSFNAVFIDFPSIIKKDSIAHIKVFYNGTPQEAKHAPWDGGFSWSKDENGNPWIGVSCQGTGASCWWPCKDHQSDEPNEMSIAITLPDSLIAVSNGRLKKQIQLDRGNTRFEWYVSKPINNYDVTLNIAKYKHFSDNYVNANFKDTLTLDYFVLPYNFEKAKKHFEQVKPMLDCYYKQFGEYPFVSDGYKLVETPYLGMEHQSCIAYGNKYMSGYLGRDLSGAGYDFDYIIIHESAHEWWGNNVTTNDIADMWIHEGFGTYSEALYVEYIYGYAAYLKYINGEKKSVKNRDPITGKYDVNNMGSRDMYPKGALLLHTIRNIVNNDSLFFEMIMGIQKTFRYKTINSTDIEQYISKKSEIDFSNVFTIYLKERSIPLLLYKVNRTANGIKLKYRYNTDNPFTMPVKATLNKNAFDFIYPTNYWQTLTINHIKKADFKIATDLFYIDVERK